MARVHCGKDVFQMLYREYTGYMRNARLIDFDDMLVFTKEFTCLRIRSANARFSSCCVRYC